MTPATEIAKLDRQIAAHGQAVFLRKAAAANANDDKTIRAFVRGYKPDELAGGINQGDSTVILSPAAFSASGFAGPIKRLDKITVAGRLRTVEVVNPVTMNDQVVRIEIWLRG